MSRVTPPLHMRFDSTPEIFATDSAGSFQYPLLVDAKPEVDTHPYDETRFVFSLWHPSSKISIDLDRAYVELRGRLDPQEEHWVKLAEVEPVVPPYAAGDSFDGWIVLPVLAATTSFALFGSGFEARSRLQIRASGYLVA